MGDRCTGNCCREFALPAAPEMLRTWAETEKVPALAAEYRKIADLAVFVRTCGPGDPMPSGKPYGDGEPVPIYTCRFFDGATGNCTNYDERPNMCRAYPYDRPCEHGDACTYDDARAGRVPGVEGRRQLSVLS